jgi:hypothetical protein
MGEDQYASMPNASERSFADIPAFYSPPQFALLAASLPPSVISSPVQARQHARQNAIVHPVVTESPKSAEKRNELTILG